MSVSEVANLWDTYTSDRMALCMLQQFANHIEDEELGAVFRQAYEDSYDHVHTVNNDTQRTSRRISRPNRLSVEMCKNLSGGDEIREEESINGHIEGIFILWGDYEPFSSDGA